MPRYKVENVTMIRAYSTDRIDIIEYKRRKKPPTLKQFAVRKHFSAEAKRTKGTIGVVRVNGKLMPSSAKHMMGVSGMNADKLITPEIEQEYNKKFKKQRKRTKTKK